ncbi:esterase/lipase family protein [Piscinibacterium candidicorallinum]|uniref:Esterase/lipase family protein n=1 Tax=Piscinibacterium candidicorallinum TaxID=1793872 RepID=A0ABV7H6A4_9BURK
MSSNPFDLYNEVPIQYDDQGRPYADAGLTPVQDSKRTALVVPASKVIPVVFLPGIMGSNLRLVEAGGFDTNGLAWNPGGAWWMLSKFRPLSPSQRRRLLDPANTEVALDMPLGDEAVSGFNVTSATDGRAGPNAQKRRVQNLKAEFTRRGWGSVMLGSGGYLPFLAYLELHLNRMFWRGQLDTLWSRNVLQRKRTTGRNITAAVDWDITKGDKPLSEQDLKKAAEYWLPVHAVGYNWIRSNEDAGKYVAKRVEGFIAHYTKLGYQCDKVILVTHSMGGLVARAACSPQIGNLAGKTLGVIHGVMPATGAAAAYWRCQGGFEGWARGWDAASGILGPNGPAVAAVFSGSPGALQLLPSKQYGSGWLQFKDAKGRVLEALPKANPYSEIYSQESVWWRLMRPDWIDPDNFDDLEPRERRLLWARFTQNLKYAESFHDKIANYYHPLTHAQYANDDEDHKAFGNAVWRITNYQGVSDAEIHSSSNIYEDDQHGRRLVVVDRPSKSWILPDDWLPRDRFWGRLEMQDEAGDGTVPVRSGAAAAKHAQFVCAHRPGYDHQGSWNDDRPRTAALYSVARIISEAL